LLDRAGNQLSIPEQGPLKLADLLGAEWIGRTLEVSRPLTDSQQINLNGSGRIVPTLSYKASGPAKPHENLS
jgi:hypothetical protein